MKILMLGWEYPPNISGGLGTACEGLTGALSRLGGFDIDFVVPYLYGGELAAHMRLIDASTGRDALGNLIELAKSIMKDINDDEKSGLRTFRIPSFLSPYWSEEQYKELREKILEGGLNEQELMELFGEDIKQRLKDQKGSHYGRDIFEEVTKFAERVVSLFSRRRYDIIHAHDWMTMPAGVALSRLTGVPLVQHVHSLEYDRSGNGGHPKIREVESVGVKKAKKVIAVSHYTAGIIYKEYGIAREKIAVVHNGVYPRKMILQYKDRKKWPEHVVLFLGRITFQKGPEYFVEAAARVVPHVPDVLFVMAGAGDMLLKVKNRVKELGLEDHFQFPGFLRGAKIEEVFSAADLYVMPSVSEPFGISALEAISFDTPVIISKQSGVSEVLSHALKSDFWDVERMADLMINALCYKDLRSDMVSMARNEISRLRWDAAAKKVAAIYRSVVD
ncbi:MAG: glycosyltransferase [SAR324 cluster bacterium]|uniref:Glycosyltransferase n=1 Tax=SAR324 cluster bacterium TaxID=2024889 RepID=A0A7X9IJL2_9DELT|nr:glycosyltransferase [SAR324 cluster bacterium]